MLKEKCKDLLRSIAAGFDDINNMAGADLKKATEVSAEALMKLAKEPSFASKLGVYVRASYLTSPGAHVLNTVSNLFQIGMHPVLTALSGRPREALEMFKGMGEGFTLAYPRFMSTFKNVGVDPSRLDFSGTMSKDTELNNVLVSPLTLTRAIDNASKGILEAMMHGALYQKVRSQIPASYLQRKGVTNEQLRKGINDYLLGNQSTDSAAIALLEKSLPNLTRYKSYIENTSDYVTFNRKLGDSILDVAGKQLEGFREKHPLITLLFPFIKTPINVAKEGAGYIPGIGVLRERQAKLDMAKISNEITAIKQNIIKANERVATSEGIQSEAAKAYKDRLQKSLETKQGELMMLKELPARYRAQQFLGAGLMAYAYSLYENSELTGHFVDPAVRATKEAQGIPPMSIKIGGRWISYDKLEPFSTVIGSVADAVETLKASTRKGEERDAGKIAGMVAQTVGQNIFNKTFTEQLGNVMMAMQQPERYGNPFAQLLNPAVPSIVAQVAKYQDPYKRDVRGENIVESLTNPVLARIPGQREQLPQMYDILGNPVKAAAIDSNAAKAFDVFGGIKTAPTEQTPQQQLLTNPYLSVSPMQRKIQGMELTPKQYSEMTQQAGTLVNDIITDLSSDPQFLTLPYAQQAYAVKNAISRARTGGRNMYLSDMIEKDPAVLDKYIEGKLRSKGALEE